MIAQATAVLLLLLAGSAVPAMADGAAQTSDAADGVAAASEGEDGSDEALSDNVRALCGLFSYANTRDGVASFGTVMFDGLGGAEMHLKINAVSSNGGRNTREVRAVGPYTFTRELMGTMVFDVPDLNIDGAHYDFVAVAVEGARPVELFAVLRAGGVNGQLVDPVLRRISGCGG